MTVRRDSASCGYHALKNAIIGVLAVINRNENEEVRALLLCSLRNRLRRANTNRVTGGSRYLNLCCG